MEVSKWVLHRIGEVSKIVGISFEGFECEAMTLFAAIEKKWRGKMVGNKNEVSKQKKVMRELRKLKLECTVDYDRNRGSGKLSREAGYIFQQL